MRFLVKMICGKNGVVKERKYHVIRPWYGKRKKRKNDYCNWQSKASKLLYFLLYVQLRYSPGLATQISWSSSVACRAFVMLCIWAFSANKQGDGPKCWAQKRSIGKGQNGRCWWKSCCITESCSAKSLTGLLYSKEYNDDVWAPMVPVASSKSRGKCYWHHRHPKYVQG